MLPLNKFIFSHANSTRSHVIGLFLFPQVESNKVLFLILIHDKTMTVILFTLCDYSTFCISHLLWHCYLFPVKAGSSAVKQFV